MKIISLIAFSLLSFGACVDGTIEIPEDTPILIEAPEPEPPGELDNLVIGVYWPPTWEQVTDAQFDMLADAHVDMLQYVITYTEAQNMTILDKSRDRGMRSIIFDARAYGSDAELADMVNAYRSHAGLGGYYIKDEPSPAELDWAAAIYNKIYELDADHIPHVNLFPSFATHFTEGIDYKNDYMQGWINRVGGAARMKFLSLDVYPFMADGTFNPVYYHELDRLRSVALENSDIRTSAYLQSLGVEGAYRRPNEHELRYNVYSMLAYGIKYPVWFTYCTPDNTVNETFTEAIIDRDGNKTDLYVPFKTLNGEMKALGSKLFVMQSQIVYHTGEGVPSGVESLPAEYFVQPDNPNEDLLIAQLKNWPEGGRNYAMIVNKSLTEAKELTFNIAGWITDMDEVSKTTGSENPITINEGKVTLTFMPGEGRLFGFKPF